MICFRNTDAEEDLIENITDELPNNFLEKEEVQNINSYTKGKLS